MKPLYKFASNSAYFISKHVFGLRVRGLENIPATGPVILASNHTSYIDPPLIGGISRREIFFLAKKELFDNRLLGWFVRNLNAFPVDREKLDPSTIKTIFRVLRSGGGVLMFPEGTRIIGGKLGPFKNGVAAVALKSGAEVVPVWIMNSYGVVRKRLRGRRLEVSFGRPFNPAEIINSSPGRDRYEEFNRELRARMVQLNRPWK